MKNNKTKRPYTVMGKHYGVMVANGLRILPGVPNPEGLPVIPKRFVAEVKQFLEWRDAEIRRRAKERGIDLG